MAFPTDLATRLGTGWTVPIQDTFGEFQIGIWLRERASPQADADAAAAGWGGDRLAVIEGPDGAWAVAIETAWDTTPMRPSSRRPRRPRWPRRGDRPRSCPARAARPAGSLVANDAATMSRVAGVLGLAG